MAEPEQEGGMPPEEQPPAPAAAAAEDAAEAEAAPPPPAEPADAPAPTPPPATPAAAAPAAATPKMAVPPQVQERLGDPKSLEGISDDEVKAILKDYYDRWVASENDVYDISHSVKVRDMQIHELEMEVSDMRGKFIIPKLKKVHNFKLMGGEE